MIQSAFLQPPGLIFCVSHIRETLEIGPAPFTATILNAAVLFCIPGVRARNCIFKTFLKSEF